MKILKYLLFPKSKWAWLIFQKIINLESKITLGIDLWLYARYLCSRDALGLKPVGQARRATIGYLVYKIYGVFLGLDRAQTRYISEILNISNFSRGKKGCGHLTLRELPGIKKLSPG